MKFGIVLSVFIDTCLHSKCRYAAYQVQKFLIPISVDNELNIHYADDEVGLATLPK